MTYRNYSRLQPDVAKRLKEQDEARERELAERAKINEEARQRRLAAEEAARQADRERVEQRELARITDQFRRDFLRNPGATEADFQRVLPRLLEEHRIQETVGRQERIKAGLLAKGWYDT